MSEDLKKEIEKYIEAYRLQKEEEVIDDYQLFGADQTKSSSELKEQYHPKKMYKLFHPDQKEFLNQTDIEDYINLVTEYYSFSDRIDSTEKKSAYDRQLATWKARKEETLRQRSKSETKPPFEPKGNQPSLASEEKLNAVFLEQIKESGIHGIQMAMYELWVNQSFSGFTDKNQARKLAQELGPDQIAKLLSKHQKGAGSLYTNVLDYYGDALFQDEVLSEKYRAFLFASSETYSKYAAMNPDFLNGAIRTYIEKGQASGFTRSENARQDLVALVNPFEAQAILIASVRIARRKVYGSGESSYEELSQTPTRDLAAQFERHVIRKTNTYGGANYDSNAKQR